MLFSELKWTATGPHGRQVSQNITNADRSLVYCVVEDIPTGMFTVRIMYCTLKANHLVDSGNRMWRSFTADLTTIACFIHDLTPWGDERMQKE